MKEEESRSQRGLVGMQRRKVTHHLSLVYSRQYHLLLEVFGRSERVPFEFKKWKKGDLAKDEENLTNLEEEEQKTLQKVKNSYEKSKEKATAKVAVGRMDQIKKEVGVMVAEWKPGDTEKGNDPDSMKKLFLNAIEVEECPDLLSKVLEFTEMVIKHKKIADDCSTFPSC